jgi:predicted nicotinamide N-methyase
MTASTTDIAYRHPTRIHIFQFGSQGIKITAPADPDALLDDPEAEKRYATDQSLPYWPVIWPSSLMLADQIFSFGIPADTDGQPRRVLELGCGLGIAGIAAGLIGCRVTFSDYDRDAILFADHNARSNGLQHYSTRMMDWRRPDNDLFNWIIASDVLYERRLHEILINLMDQMLAPDGEVWMTDPQRTAAADFPLLAASHGYRCSSTEVKWESPLTPKIAGTFIKISRVKSTRSAPVGQL